MALNVNRNVSDPFYRYKMPRIMAKVEGKGNGIKTVISNMVDIAKALERPPIYPTKYFGCELGAQTQIDVKNERYIVNGEHDAAKLQDILDGFIKKFVLCGSCENPETALLVRKNQIHSKCKACGHSAIIDPRWRLSTYIIKNPPKIEVDLNIGNPKANKTNGKPAADTNGDAQEDGNDSKHGSSSGDDIQVQDDDDDDWAEAPEIDADKLAAGVGKLVISADLEKSIDERLDMLHTFFQEKKKKDAIGDGLDLANEAERLDIKQKAPLILANVIFDDNIITEKQIEKYAKCLLRFTANDSKAQRYFLGGIEQVIVRHKDSLMARAPHIIKALYDLDICEEEAILKWAEKPSSKYVSKSQAKAIIAACEPVINWLKEAEEETEDEDDDEDEDDEVAFDSGKTSAVAQQLEERKKKQVETIEAHDGEEIAVDDI